MTENLVQYTVLQIAEILQEPPQRIDYIIKKHRLKPVQRIGLIRLFTEADIKAIKQGCYCLGRGF